MLAEEETAIFIQKGLTTVAHLLAPPLVIRIGHGSVVLLLRSDPTERKIGDDDDLE
jgi:hypothetical protein